MRGWRLCVLSGSLWRLKPNPRVTGTTWTRCWRKRRAFKGIALSYLTIIGAIFSMWVKVMAKSLHCFKMTTWHDIVLSLLSPPPHPPCLRRCRGLCIASKDFYVISYAYYVIMCAMSWLFPQGLRRWRRSCVCPVRRTCWDWRRRRRRMRAQRTLRRPSPTSRGNSTYA